jgi:hypothetical protein
MKCGDRKLGGIVRGAAWRAIEHGNKKGTVMSTDEAKIIEHGERKREDMLARFEERQIMAAEIIADQLGPEMLARLGRFFTRLGESGPPNATAGNTLTEDRVRTI